MCAEKLKKWYTKKGHTKSKTYNNNIHVPIQTISFRCLPFLCHFSSWRTNDQLKQSEHTKYHFNLTCMSVCFCMRFYCFHFFSLYFSIFPFHVFLCSSSTDCEYFIIGYSFWYEKQHRYLSSALCFSLFFPSIRFFSNDIRFYYRIICSVWFFFFFYVTLLFQLNKRSTISE